MINRHVHTLAATALLALLVVLPGGARVEAEPRAVLATPPAKVQPVPTGQSPARTKGPTRAKARPRQPDSHFVTLCRLLTGEVKGAAPLDGATVNGFEPENIDLILGTGTSQWVLGYVPTASVALADPDLILLKTSIASGPLAPQALSPKRSPRSVGKKMPAARPFSLPGDRSRDPFAITEFIVDDPLGLTTGFNDRLDQYADSARNPAASPFALHYQGDGMAVKAGFSWVKDLTGTHPSPRAFDEAGPPPTEDQVSGLNVNLGARYRAFSLTGGYTRAFDRFAPTQLFPEEGQSDLGAWNSELAYTTELLQKETVLAVGYQKSSEALQAYLPEQRYSTKASMSLLEGTTLSLEYYLDKDGAVDQGSGTDENGYGITTRIGFGL